MTKTVAEVIPAAAGFPSYQKNITLSYGLQAINYTGKFTSCVQSNHHKMLTRRAEAMIEAVTEIIPAAADFPYYQKDITLSYFNVK